MHKLALICAEFLWVLLLKILLICLKVHPTLILPHLAVFCEICENRDQLRWIKDTAMRLRDTMLPENVVCHQVGEYINFAVHYAVAVVPKVNKYFILMMPFVGARW